jgi:hypothetical protein
MPVDKQQIQKPGPKPKPKPKQTKQPRINNNMVNKLSRRSLLGSV